MARAKCDMCRDAAMKAAVGRLLDMNRTESKEALILQYLLLHKTEYIDAHEFLMLITGVFGNGWDLESVRGLIEDMRARFVCAIGVELIEHRPESGYRIASCCALFDEQRA